MIPTITGQTFIFFSLFVYEYNTMFGDVEERFKSSFNPFAPGDFAEKRVFKLVKWFSGHCRAIKS